MILFIVLDGTCTLSTIYGSHLFFEVLSTESLLEFKLPTKSLFEGR